MVDFRRNAKTPLFVDRRFRRWLLGVFLVIAVLLIAVRELERPFLGRFFLGTNESGGAMPLDTTFHPPPSRALPPDVFIAVRQASDAPVEKKDELGLDRNLLAGVKDRTMFFSAEHAAFYHIFDVLRKTNPAQLKRRAQQVTHRQLFDQPSVYRGEVVTLRGGIRGAERIPATRNNAGIQEYYALVLQPKDNPSELVRVYCLELPPQFPLRARGINEAATITGISYKLQAYKAEKDLRLAPMVLARSIDWQPAPVEQQVEVDTKTLAACVLGALALAAIAVLVAWRWTGHRDRMPLYVARHAGEQAAPERVSFQGIDAPARPERPEADSSHHAPL